MTKRISIQQLESYLWGAATLLRGTIDAGDYKQFIFPLLFYKRLCDVYDEETQLAVKESGGDAAFAAFPENHRFQIPTEAHWQMVRQVAKDVGKALQSEVRAIETANPDKLLGIFGDAQWTNKDRLPDAMLRDLIEHFSSLELSLANLPEDELGNGYEYLIKKFADDSGHTAAEFYTNRTVVNLMTELLQPQPEESIYDPTCGSGGMLISCIAQLRRQDKEWRNVHLYGQERNLMTSSIARMNCFLHGIEDFRIERGDTLSEPKFVQGDRLQQFDLVLANPPYSIKQWDRTAFSKDPWGRNLYGTPPQGRADYAFWQHILCSLKAGTGRCAILFPHGVLFRQEEADMREKIIGADVIECIIGLGPNLFYNSPMEACIVICRTAKPKERRGKIIYINAVDEVTRERAQSFLTDEHVEHITAVYTNYKDEPGFSKVVHADEIRKQGWNLSIPLYVASEKTKNGNNGKETDSLESTLKTWWNSRKELVKTLKEVLPDLKIPEISNDVRFNHDIGLLNDRSNWKRVKFGDVVENINETENNPLDTGITRFIGLEHLERGSLHLRTWGNVSDGITFTRRCHPGQVLFGKRRAYQRKIALAEFDAIVSGDIYVLKAKTEKLVSDLLPFICMSDSFFEHAVGTSAGSLSPRTNWTSLAKYNLNLPPLDRQKRIAEILWAVDDSIQRYRLCIDEIDCLKTSYMENIFNTKRFFNNNDEEINQIRIGDICHVFRGASPRPIGDHKWFSDKGPGWVRISDVSKMSKYLRVTEQSLSKAGVSKSVQVFPGDVIMSICATIGIPAIVDMNACIHDGFVVFKDISEKLNKEYLYYFLQYSRRDFENKAQPGTQKNLNSNIVKQAIITLPSIEKQNEICGNLNRIYKQRELYETHIETLSRLRVTITNVFMGG